MVVPELLRFSPKTLCTLQEAVDIIDQPSISGESEEIEPPDTGASFRPSRGLSGLSGGARQPRGDAPAGTTQQYVYLRSSH